MTTFVTERRPVSGAEHACRDRTSLLSRRRPHRAPAVSRHARRGRDHFSKQSERLSEARLHAISAIRSLRFLARPWISPACSPSYGVRGTSTYSKGLFTANATSWLDLYGQFLYSQPKTNVNYQQNDTGTGAREPDPVLHQRAVSGLRRGEDAAHHVRASARRSGLSAACASSNPGSRTACTTAGSATSNQTLASAGVSEQMAALLASSLVTNYNQAEIDAFYDAPRN